MVGLEETSKSVAELLRQYFHCDVHDELVEVIMSASRLERSMWGTQNLEEASV
jgi:hypothetical protein